MKKIAKKLSLRAETIRALELTAVTGGASVKLRCNPTLTCPTVCIAGCTSDTQTL